MNKVAEKIKVGDKFNMWTVIGCSFTDKAKNYKRMVLCKCECGSEKDVAVWDLIRGRNLCCGCARKGAMGKQFKTGDVIGHWTVVSEPYFCVHPKRGREQMLRLKCVCGKEVERKSTQFTKSRSETNPRSDMPSCGCKLEKLKSVEAVNNSVTTFRLRAAWHCMKRRCLSEKDPSWINYGGRGISICESWMVFGNYKTWSLENGYSIGLSLDRIDPDGNYCPENCEWVTKEENSKRTTTARQKKFAEVKAENERLKTQIHELEMRVSALEGHEIIRQDKSEKFITEQSE